MHTSQTQFNNFAYDWLKSSKASYRKTSYDSYSRMLDKQILPVIGKLPIGQITPEIIGYVTTGKREYSPRSKNAVISVIRNVCDYAASEGVSVDINWSELFASPEQEKLRILSDYEIEKLTKYLTAGGLPELGIFLALHTGVSVAELCALKRADIDFESANLHVSKTLIRVKNEGGETLTKTEIFDMPEAALVRDIPLNEKVLNVIKRRYSRFDEDAFLLTGKPDPTYPEKVQYYFKKAARECNIHGMKFSVLRDTFADRLLKSGTDIMTVCKYLGTTATITVTNRHSAKNVEEMRGKSVKRNEANETTSELFGDLANEWLELVREKTKLSTYSKYRRDCEKFILPFLGKLKLAEISRDDINRFVESLSGVAPSSVNAMISEINLVFTYAKSCGIKNSIDLGSFKINTKRETLKTISETACYNIFKDYLLSNIDLTKAGILLLAETGIKAGELCALKKRDIDFENRSLHIENTVQRLQTEDGKTEVLITRLNGENAVRDVPLSEGLCKLLTQLYESLDDDSFVLTGSTKNTEVRALSYRLKNCLTQCRLDQNISFNILRDSYLVRRVNAGDSLSEIAVTMGYSSPEQVKERYNSCVK